MKIKVNRAVAESLGKDKMRTVGHELDSRSYRDHFEVNLAELTARQLADLQEWFEDLVKLGVRGPKTLIHDIKTWNTAIASSGNTKARTLSHFADVLTQYLRKVPGHRVYKRLDLEGIAHVAYYVNKVTYHKAERTRDYHHPAHVAAELFHIELGGRKVEIIDFLAENANQKTPAEAMALMGYFREIPELREAYLGEIEKFTAVANNVGQQFLAVGTGTDDLDGNPESENRWSSYGKNAYPMECDGLAAKVVIDVFHESEKERRDRESGHLDQRFWERKRPATESGGDDEDLAAATEDDDVMIGEETIEVPIHPFCATFDLRRHLRLRVHINYLTKYEYNESLSDALILPAITKDLVFTLISQGQVNFSDIIAGKAGGVCVLLTGVPGVGKTLTAEVFAEASKKPLYSIQAAQLGTRADQIEKNLMRFLARGSRWDAVVLIDEADVYVRARDTDMDHNATVAAFLRVLEYQSSVLFMTTNLAESVDDAIASRCIARIDYEVPDLAQQTDIWRVLNKVNKAGISEPMIKKIVSRHNELTGRDIKQLLKLAGLVSEREKTPISLETIDFVSQFQPTKRRSSNVNS